MKHVWLPVLFISMMLTSPVQGAQKTPIPPSARAKCPVCGMFVAKYPDWIGAVTFEDGGTVYFDGPKDLFTYYLGMKKYEPAKSTAAVAALHVKDYYSLAFIDGRQAFYVIGSDVLGPMGNELIPFRKRSDADGFLKDHAGKRVLRFAEITGETLKTLE